MARLSISILQLVIVLLLALAKPNEGRFVDDLIEDAMTRTVMDNDKKCKTTAGELIFVLDDSTSVGPKNFKKEQIFSTKIVDKLTISSALTRVALITYNSLPSLVFNLHQHDTTSGVNAAIMKAEFSEGITAVGDALNEVLKSIHPKTRTKTGKVIVLISDGKANGGMDPVAISKQLKSSGYTIVTIGLDSDSDAKAMKTIATDNEFYLIKNFDALEKIVSKIVAKTCKTFHVRKCPKTQTRDEKCVNGKRTIHVRTHYYTNGRCVSESRRYHIACHVGQCSGEMYTIGVCRKTDNSTFLVHISYQQIGKACKQIKLNLKTVNCGCHGSKATDANVVLGRTCKKGMMDRVLVYHEFDGIKCVERFHKLTAVKCSLVCNGTSTTRTPCVSNRREKLTFQRQLRGDKCQPILLRKEKETCTSECPRTVTVRSLTCKKGIRVVYRISFVFLNDRCTKKVSHLAPEKCDKAKRE